MSSKSNIKSYDFTSLAGPGLNRDIPPKHRSRSPVPTEDEVMRNHRRLSFFEKPGDQEAARRASNAARLSFSSTSSGDNSAVAAELEKLKGLETLQVPGQR